MNATCWTVSTIAMGVFFVAFSEQTKGGSVPMWGMFETSITNTTNYANKFRDVELNATFTAPSNKQVNFWGFFDGDGSGGPSRFDGNNPPLNAGGELTGTVWKLRFMPDETGTWTYIWSFSDGSKSGSGSFTCTASGAKPGPLQVLSSNWYWFQRPDGTPVFPRTFRSNMMSENLCYPASTFGPAVYQKAIDRGCNLISVNALPLMAWSTAEHNLNPANGPYDSRFLLWYQKKAFSGKPSGGVISETDVFDSDRMNLFAYKRMEDHFTWLAARGAYVIPFQGFAIKRSTPAYRTPNSFSTDKARWYLKYNMARLAPMWNMTWNYTWEVDPGTAMTDEFGQWIDEFDPWDHLNTAEAYHTGDFSNPVYDFSSWESFGPLNDGQVTGMASYQKPMFMAEDNGGLWNASVDTDFAMDKAWRLITQGSFFGWQEYKQGWNDQAVLWSQHFTTSGADRLMWLYSFIGDETDFARLKPHQELITGTKAYCLADPGSQYVLYKSSGGSFNVTLPAGTFTATWLDPSTNGRAAAANVTGPGTVSFTTPQTKHYVLFLKVQGGITPKYGDADEDGSVGMGDLNLIVDWLLGRQSLPTIGSAAFINADVDGSSSIAMGDLNLLVDFILGRISKFPVE